MIRAYTKNSHYVGNTLKHAPLILRCVVCGRTVRIPTVEVSEYLSRSHEYEFQERDVSKASPKLAVEYREMLVHKICPKCQLDEE